MTSPTANEYSAFDVPAWLDFVGGLVDRHPNFFIRLARLESKSLGSALGQTPITMPIYICGLARAGTTLLHEVVAAHPAVATHQMKDYPLVFTPYWWRRATARLRPGEPRERAHHDRMLVTIESPDALEEMLWIAHFRRCHDPSVNNVLGAADSHPEFETFYRDHLRKLLLATARTRYAAKDNYHVMRLGYLARLFGDARFVIVVRSPERHIASLMRQHAWFCEGHRRSPRSLAFMQRSGHFEFGLDRRPMQLGDASLTAQIVEDWTNGREALGWARYWNMVYTYLDQLLQSDAELRAASCVVRFETLCESPAETLGALLRHCQLSDADELVERFAATIRDPAYYTGPFSPDERERIADATGATARRWGVIHPA